MQLGAPRTPRERCGFAFLPRDDRGRVVRVDALSRFAAKCRFEPTTGCVVWTGGKTRGRGNTATYGSFWYEGARWFAHRWAGQHIHGLDLRGVQAGHCCPGGPNSLCVQHVVAQTVAENMAEQYERLGNPATRRPVEQSNAERQYWLLVDRGYEPPPEGQTIDPDAIPFHTPPDWLRPFLAKPEDTECPF